MGEPKTSIIWKTTDRRANWSEIWDLRAVVQYVNASLAFLNNLSMLCLESLGALAIFAKYDIQNISYVFSMTAT